MPPLPPPPILADNFSSSTYPNSNQTSNYIAQSNVINHHGVNQVAPQSHPYANNQMTGFTTQQNGNTSLSSPAYGQDSQYLRDSFNILGNNPYQQQRIPMETSSSYMHLQSSNVNGIALPVNNLDVTPPPPTSPPAQSLSSLSPMSPKQNRNCSTFKRKLPNPPDQLPTIDSVNGSCDADENTITICKKRKRKPMSMHYTTKEWNREDAIKAVEFEKEMITGRGGPMLILKFPDPKLNRDIIKSYASEIENVHFQQPLTPRFCFVSLKDGCDINAVEQKLSKIPFGTGKIIAERKVNVFDASCEITPEDIDPYTLYIGNLPTKLSVKKVKKQFPGCVRIDVGFAQRTRYTRYAFIRYDSLDKSIAAFRDACQWNLGPRSVIVRFRRNKGNISFNNSPISQHHMLSGSMETFDDDFDNMGNISETTPTAKDDVCKLMKPNIQLKPFSNITKSPVPTTTDEQSTISTKTIASPISDIPAATNLNPLTDSIIPNASKSPNKIDIIPIENGETSTQNSISDESSIFIEIKSEILENCKNATNKILPPSSDTKEIKSENLDDIQIIAVKSEPLDVHVRIQDCDDVEMDYPGDTNYLDSSPDMRNSFFDDISSDDEDTDQHITEHIDMEYSSELNSENKIKIESTSSEEKQHKSTLILPPDRSKIVEDDPELNRLFDTLNPDDGFSL